MMFAVVWFGTLDMRKLVRPDEGRYAEIPREMVTTGDWLTPRLNAIKYFEKPPLQYWATATAYTLFGEHEWTARLWPALTGFLCVLLVGFTGWRLFGAETGMLAAIILAGSPGFVMVGQINTLDMGLTLFMTATLAFVLLGLNDTKGHQSPWLLAAWGAAALAMLSKGLIAIVLPGAVVAAYILLQRDWRLLQRLRWGWGLVLFLAIAAPWFVLVQRANPEFFDFFFIHEHFARFATKAHRRVGAWWYFLPVLVFAILPWLAFLPRALTSAWRDTRDRSLPQPRRLLLLWVVIIFVFFSLSSSKLPSYIMPILPALALLLAHALRTIGLRALMWNALALAVVGMLIMIYAPYVTHQASTFVPATLFARYSPWLVAAGAASLVLCSLGAWASYRGLRLTAMTAIAAGLLATTLIAGVGHGTLAPSYSAYGLAQQIMPRLQPGVPFYSVRTYDQTLDFYIKRTVTLVEFSDEMSFGLRQEPHLWLPDLPAFVKAWQSHAQAYAIMDAATYAKLEQEGLPMRIIGRDVRRIVVQKLIEQPDAGKEK